VRLNIANPEPTPSGTPNITYDVSGNRDKFRAYGVIEDYTVNGLNQYTQRTKTPGGTMNAAHDIKGNMTTNVDSPVSMYTYDAQNRLLTATRNGVTETFTYDGLGRQVSRQIGTGPVTYNVYDGWNLIAEYAPSASSSSPKATYIYGPTGLTKGTMAVSTLSTRYFYQDASGSTSHLTGLSGQIEEWYRYDLQGMPLAYAPDDNSREQSQYQIRHLFTGQQWYHELGLYDLRNRFYSPDIGRFLQPDPIGFSGDWSNLYRYCGNNPINFADPDGLIGGEGIGLVLGGALLGGINGLAAGVTFQAISAFNGHGFSLKAVALTTAGGVAVGTVGGMVAAALVADVPGLAVGAVIVAAVKAGAVGAVATGAAEGAVGYGISRALAAPPNYGPTVPFQGLVPMSPEFWRLLYQQGYNSFQDPVTGRVVVVGNSSSFTQIVSSMSHAMRAWLATNSPNFSGVRVWGGNGLPLTSLGGGSWRSLSPGWASFPGPEPGEGSALFDGAGRPLVP
jgi:RHS repeat-associated protein